MGTHLISNLKRAGYLGAAAVLTLAAMPVWPMTNAWAEGATTEVDSCDGLAAALADSDVSTITLGADLSGCTAMNLTMSKTIDGGGHSLGFEGNNGFNVTTNGAIALKNLTVNTSYRGVNIESAASDSTLDDVTLNVGERGVTYSGDYSAGASLTVKNSTIQNNTVADYDKDWMDSDHSRGISFWNYTNSVANITNTTIQGFKYVINMGAGDYTGSVFNLAGATLKGWGDLNMWQSNATINVTDSDLLGIMAHNDTTTWNNFSDVVLNSGANNNTVTLNNVRMKNAYPYASAAGVAGQAMMSGGKPLSQGNVVTLNNCDFDDTLPGRLQHGIMYNMGGNTVKVESGTYDVAIDWNHLGDNKVNYLKNGRYVVDELPTGASQNLPEREIVEAGEYTIDDLATDTIAQKYANIWANRGDQQMPSNPTLMRDADGNVIGMNIPGAGYGAFKIVFPMYVNGVFYDDDTYTTYSRRVISYTDFSDVSYDKTMLFDAYEAEEVGTKWVEQGSAVDVDVDVVLDNYNNTERTVLDVYLADETGARSEEVATIAKGGDTYKVTGVADGQAKIMAKISLKSDESNSKTIELGTVNVYSFSAASEVTIPVGTEVNLADGVISQIGNPGTVTVELSGDAATLSGATATTATAEGTLTATDAGNATLTFKVGETVLGTTTVKVYELPELEDIILQSHDSDGILSTSATFPKLEGTNLPEYTVVTTSPQLINISNNSDGSKTIRTMRRFQHSGNATVYVYYNDSLGTTYDMFNVTVSKFVNGAENTYNVARGDEVEFRMRESNSLGEVSCEIDGEACDESTAFDVTENDGQYTVEAKETATAGEHTLAFVDKFGNVVAGNAEVKIRVHEVTVLDENGADVENVYVVRNGDAAELTVKEANDYGWIGYVVRDENGQRSHGKVSVSQSGDDVTISLNNRDDVAGYYTIEFQNCNSMLYSHYCANPIASKTVNVYAIDFVVDVMEYHVNNNDTSEHLINAINRFWGENGLGGTDYGDVEHLDGRASSRFRVTSAADGSVTEGDGYNFRIRHGGAAADHYTLELYALVNGEVRDTKTVDIYVYDMSHPSADTYYGEVSNGGEYTFTGIDVDDDLNAIIPDQATITATASDAENATVDVANGTVTVKRPGQYTVEYQDVMKNGEVADTWTATFNVYGLSAEVEDDVLNLNADETYGWTIDLAQTYGSVRTTITRRGPTGSPSRTVLRDETRYDGAGTGAEEHSFDPAQYGEGKYTIRIENRSVGRHGLAPIVYEATFYVIAREYDFVVVPQGREVEITSGSRWSVDDAEEYFTGDANLTIDGETVTLDTTELPLGITWVDVRHEFGGGQRETLKFVNVIVYKVTPDETTDPEEVTKDTIEALIDELLGSDVDDAETLARLEEVLGGEWVSTLGRLETAILLGEEINTRVQVTDLNEDEVEEEMIEAVSALGAEHADYYDVSVLMETNGIEIGKLHKLNGKITVALATVSDPADGYTRQYFVLRDHNGTVTVLEEGVDFYIENGVLYVISDEFSTYAVAYKDTLLPKSPDTGEETAVEGGAASVSLSTAIVVTLAALTVAGALIFAKRK